MDLWMRDFSKRCMTGLGKTIAQVLSYSFAKIAKTSCTNRRKRREFVKYAKCGNFNKTGTLQCTMEYNNAITVSVQEPDHKLKFPSVCW